jgi:hypothetical protein
MRATLRPLVATAALTLALVAVGGSPAGGSSRTQTCADFEVPNGPAIFSVRTVGVSCRGAHRMIVSFMTRTSCSSPCRVHGFWCRETFGGGNETSGNSDFLVTCRADNRRVRFIHGV